MKANARADFLVKRYGLILGEMTLEELREMTREHVRKTVRIRGRSMVTGRKKHVLIPLFALAVGIGFMKGR